jgi:hypothetical protein
MPSQRFKKQKMTSNPTRVWMIFILWSRKMTICAIKFNLQSVSLAKLMEISSMQHRVNLKKKENSINSEVKPNQKYHI